VRKNIRFVSEDRAAEGVFLHLPVQSNLVAAELPSIAPLGLLSRRRVRGLALGLAKMVQLDPGRLPSLAGELSGGNQQKVAVAKSLGRVEPGVLLMNEPTRGVDVGARAEIYALMRRLCDMGYAIVMASTDIEEVVGMSDRIVTMYRSEKIREYDRAAISRAQILSDIIHPQHGASDAA
jgi:ABC-type sugar transport system ATPase subunit